MIRFETYQGRDGQWYWRAKSFNGVTVADGAEGYASRSNARRAVVRFVARLDVGGSTLDELS